MGSISERVAQFDQMCASPEYDEVDTSETNDFLRMEAMMVYDMLQREGAEEKGKESGEENHIAESRGNSGQST